jgi:hypothetical protein
MEARDLFAGGVGGLAAALDVTLIRAGGTFEGWSSPISADRRFGRSTK